MKLEGAFVWIMIWRSKEGGSSSKYEIPVAVPEMLSPLIATRKDRSQIGNEIIAESVLVGPTIITCCIVWSVCV